jgi:MFS family permease
MKSRTTVGFWGIAAAFTGVLAFTTIPTPLWSLYAARDGLSSLVVTVTFAAYALGVAASLFLAGHLSDSFGRRRVLAPAIGLNLVAAVVFVLAPSLPGLLAARVLSGLGIGAVSATATAWLVDLHAERSPAGNRRRAELVAAAANLGGLGLGALVSGLLAQWAADPLTIPYLVFIAVLLGALAIVAVAPETRAPMRPRPAYRPQRVSVPAEARPRFFAAALAAAITFALFGLLTSLAPSFLAGVLGQHSRALAGGVAFAVFAAAAVAQTAAASRTSAELLAAAIPAMVLGLALLTLAVWLPSLAMFIAGVVIAGSGAGLMFKGAIGTVSALAGDGNRAEALAGLFLAAYLGLAVPVIGLGLLIQVASVRVSLLIFAGLLAGGLLLAAPSLLGNRDDRRRSRTVIRPRRVAPRHPHPISES